MPAQEVCEKPFTILGSNYKKVDSFGTESPEEFLQRIENKLLKDVDEELFMESVSRKPVVEVASVKVSLSLIHISAPTSLLRI